jgi:hypothetical protein
MSHENKKCTKTSKSDVSKQKKSPKSFFSLIAAKPKKIKVAATISDTLYYCTPQGANTNRSNFNYPDLFAFKLLHQFDITIQLTFAATFHFLSNNRITQKKNCFQLKADKRV